MSTDYFKELEEIENKFEKDIGGLFESYVNYWSGWNKYPRKTKKYMKKKGLWGLRKLPKLNGDISVHIGRDFNKLDNLVTMPKAFYDGLRKKLSETCPEIIWRN